MPAIVFLTIIIFGPIPAVHIFLHIFLRFWRQYPYGWYIFSVLTWVLFIVPAKYAADLSSALFTAPIWLKALCIAASVCAFYVVIWSVMTLGPRRFFLLGVLRPDTVAQKYIRNGPYHFLPHPAYIAYATIILAAFFSTGEAALLIFAAVNFILMTAVICFERNELLARIYSRGNI